jgi:hypothetical protein
MKVGVLKNETPVEEAITSFLGEMSALLWRKKKMHSMPQMSFASFVHGVSSPNDKVGGCLVGWFGRSS